MPVRFCPLASGSAGNCIYLGTAQTHILIDAGLSGRMVENSLRLFNVRQLDAILVTHEHSDHVSGVGVLARRFQVPVYATPKTWRYLLRHNTIGAISEPLRRTIEPGAPLTLGDIEATAFDIPHDSSQPVGYCLRAHGYKITVATDIGCVTDTVRENVRHSHILLLESNHDVEMLRNGKYPQMLKDRVLGARGHLSNASAGALLAEVAWDGLRHVFLGHLSQENNRPLLALSTVQNILDGHNVSVGRLSVAERRGPGAMVTLD